ncbi:hypothetical protein MKW92_000180 [Papaver armeniacum]|nr:hypothetical protein MKW92_000180 [Papaver armeniacum]
MPDKSTGDIAIDQYHRYKEDVQLMVDTGLEAYRFSISWPRLIPNGRGPVNPKGLDYYNNLINELISHGIQAHVTLFHYDLPQPLEDEYGGWLSRKIVKDFTAFAEICFKEFGDRVSTWTTINEPNVFVMGAYDLGFLPPQRCSSPFGIFNCTNGGDSTTEPYLVAHNCILAHASVARLYKNKYQESTSSSYGLSPQTNSVEDVAATQRANDFYMGWFAAPLVFGEYPEIMKRNAGSRLPSFTPYEAKLVKGSCDFFGLNHYASSNVKDNPESLKIQQRDISMDMAVSLYVTNWSASKGSVLPDQVRKQYIDVLYEIFVFPVTPSGLQGVLESKALSSTT